MLSSLKDVRSKYESEIKTLKSQLASQQTKYEQDLQYLKNSMLLKERE